MNMGVLGGTFDPIHNGHIIVAEETMAQLNIDEILFVPAGNPWLKVGSPLSAAEHRVRMVRLAIADKPRFKVSTMEIDRLGPSYTIDTITVLKGQLDAGDELFFILGRDKLAELPQWKEPGHLVKMCLLATVPRPGCPMPDLDHLEASIPGLAQRVIVLDKPEVDISASEVRDRVARGLSISHLVPEVVVEYIKLHKLYLTQ